MLEIILITVFIAIAVVAVAVAYHYKAEADFNADLLDQATAQFLDSATDMAQVGNQLMLQLQMVESDNVALSHDLSQYIAASVFDAWTIRNMTASIEAINTELENANIRYAEKFLGAVVEAPTKVEPNDKGKK